MQTPATHTAPQTSTEAPTQRRTYEELRAIHEEARRHIAENEKYLTRLKQEVSDIIRTERKASGV